VLLFLSHESHVYVGGYRHAVPGILPSFINRNLNTFQYTDDSRNFNSIAKPVRFHNPITTITSGDCKLHSICNNRCIIEQGAVLTGVDVASMMRLTPATISRYVRQWEHQHQCLVPRRGTIHDMGRSVAHKRQICYKAIFDDLPFSTHRTKIPSGHTPLF
jgi:hypothetical protein